MRSLRLIVAMAIAFTVIAAPSALAAPVLSVTPVSVEAGASVTASGSGFQGDSGVEIFLDVVGGKPLATDDIPARGSFNVRFTVPVATSVGGHSVIACTDRNAQDDCREVAAASLIVNAPATTTTTSTKPPTTTTTTVPPTTSTKPPPTTSSTSTSSTTEPPTTTSQPSTTGVLTTTTVGTIGSSASPTTTSLGVPFATPTTTPPPGVVYETPEDLPDEWPDIRARGIEVTQGIQNLANDMPLVAGRRTYARVYVDVIGQDSWGPVFGVLEAWRNGELLGMVEATNNGIAAHADGGDRLDLDDSLYFLLPPDWTGGEVVLQTLVWSFGIETLEDEPESFNNVDGVFVEFLGSSPATVHPVPLHLHRGYDGSDVERVYQGAFGGISALAGSDGNIGALDVVEGMWRFHPIAELAIEPFPMTLYPSGHGSGEEWDLGYCRTTVVDTLESGEPLGPVITVADWEHFFEDPITVDLLDFVDPAFKVPDNTSVVVYDRRYTVNSVTYYPETDSLGLWGSYTSFDGPAADVGAPAQVAGCEPEDADYDAPLAAMGAHRALYDWEGNREYFVGMVDPSLASRWGGLANDAYDSAWLKFNDAFSSSAPWRHGGADLMGHEAGHLTGQSHVSCKDDDDDGVADELVGGAVDPYHPGELWFPDCRLAEIDPDGYYGFDVYHAFWGFAEPAVISNDPDAAAANRAFPLMGYQKPKWTDPYDWCRMMQYYGTPCEPNDVGIPWNPPPPGDTGPLSDEAVPTQPAWNGEFDGIVRFALVTGVVHPEDGTIEFDPVMTLERGVYGELNDALPPPPLPGESTIRVELDGVEIYHAAVPNTSDHSESDHRHIEFSGFIPVADGAEIEVLDPEGVELAKSVVAIEPVLVQAEGFEFDEGGAVDLASTTGARGIARVDLYYSADGEHWLPVDQPAEYDLESGSWVGEPPRFPGQGEDPTGQDVLSMLPGSPAGKSRVMVSTGWSTQIINGPNVKVDNKPPTVTIVTPYDGQSFAVNERILLEGTAFDLEDRHSSDSINWASSIDGFIAEGKQVEVSSLSPGVHELTATVEDGEGVVGTATIEILVDGSVVQQRLSADESAAVSQLLAALLAEEPIGDMAQQVAVTAPPTPPAGDDGGGGLGWLLALVLVFTAGGAGVLLGRRRATG